MATPKPIPEGLHTVTPSLKLKDAAKAIEFYKEAFGATERGRFEMPGGGIMHAEIVIGDSVVMLGEEMPEMGAKGPLTLGGTPVRLHIYTEDVDSLFARATKAGATVMMPVADQFWGDRYGVLADPFGHEWSIATHTKDLTVDEMKKGAEQLFSRA
jgi:PhnB protein